MPSLVIQTGYDVAISEETNNNPTDARCKGVLSSIPTIISCHKIKLNCSNYLLIKHMILCYSFFFCTFRTGKCQTTNNKKGNKLLETENENEIKKRFTLVRNLTAKQN